MSGHRHEKAALVVLAYAIAGVTAFIFYNSPADLPSQNTNLVPAAAFLGANVTLAVAPEVTVPDNQKPIVSYLDGVLRVSLLDGERVLSFNGDNANEETRNDFAVQGVHYGEINYLVSETDEFVFFCEKKAAEANICSPFVYDVLTDTIYPVRLSGTLVDIINSAEPAWNGTVLSVGTDSSKDPVKPWLLGY